MFLKINNYILHINKDDVCKVELSTKTESIRHFITGALPNLNDVNPISLLNGIHQLDVCDVYLNTEMALNIFLMLLVTVACEHSFNTFSTKPRLASSLAIICKEEKLA
jgi:hypothetical protein